MSNRASKGKQGRNKQSYAKGVTKVVDTVKDIRKEVSEFKKEWGTKFNNLSQQVSELGTKLGNLMPALAQQFAQHQASIQVQGQSLDAIDLQQQAMFKILQRIYGRFETIDAIFQKQGIDTEDLDFDALQRSAEDTYTAEAKECVRLAQEEREAILKAREEEEKKKAEEAKEAEEAKKEAEVAEQALQDAETENVGEESGGEGAEIPEGAEVFGG